jgi:hypothetical protein
VKLLFSSNSNYGAQIGIGIGIAIEIDPDLDFLWLLACYEKYPARISLG